MRPLELIPPRRLAYEPPGLCRTGIEELFALGAAGAGEAAVGATAADAAVAAGLGGAATDIGAAAGLGATYGGAATASSLSLPSLSTVGTVASGAGTLLSVKSGLDNAAYQSDLAKAEAQALRNKGNEDAAAAQRAQITKLRQTDLVLSRARALAAASGTAATSPTEVDLESDISGQGAFNAASELYAGLSRARSDTYQADIDLFKAQRISDAAPYAAFGTALSGLSNIVDKRRSGRLDTLLSTYGKL